MPVWVNSLALIKAGLLDDSHQLKAPLPVIEGGVIEVDEHGIPTGILVDAARTMVNQLIPKPTANDIKNYLLKGHAHVSPCRFHTYTRYVL